MRYILLSVIGFLVTVVFISCSEEAETTETNEVPELKNEIYNPNGDSELALLMRAMYENGEQVKKEIREGRSELSLNSFEKIHSAVPTDSTVRGPKFKAMADAYQAAVASLEASPVKDYGKMWNIVIDNCMSCHGVFCPGPRMKIRKLYIPKAEV